MDALFGNHAISFSVGNFRLIVQHCLVIEDSCQLVMKAGNFWKQRFMVHYKPGWSKKGLRIKTILNQVECPKVIFSAQSVLTIKIYL